MGPETLSDSELIQKTIDLVKQERDILTSVLHHLLEVDRRRLFSSLGYKSLFDFAVRHLGYPEDQAYRRISAMKLLREIPEIEDRITAGELSLTHIGLAQALFRQEKKIHSVEMPREQKLSVLAQIACKPVREAEKITLSLSSEPKTLGPDRIEMVSPSHVEIRFTAPAELRDKIARLKGLLAHQTPELSLADLVGRLCDLGLSQWDPGKTAAPRKRRVNAAGSSVGKAEARRQVFKRAKSQCENCGSRFALEVDHIQPLAKGGRDESRNLRVLCRSCNLRAAILNFGQQKIDRYLEVAQR